jgi:hypothetical protein
VTVVGAALWSLRAVAAEPVVYVGSEADAVERVAEATRLTAADLAPHPAASLRELPATVGAGGTLDPCTSQPITREQLLLAVESAEAALKFGEAQKAQGELARVADAHRCGPWNADLLTRWFVARALSDDDASWGFAGARAVTPGLSFAEDWPPERRAAFDAAAPQDPVQLTIAQPGFSLDGVPATGTVAVAPGWHRLAGPGFDGALTLEVDGAFLVPAAVPESVFAGLESPESRQLPTTLLAAKFGDGSRVFVANDKGVWAATAGRTDWLSLERQRTHPLVWGGLVTSAVGVVAGGVFGGLAAGAYARAEDASNAPPTGNQQLVSAVGDYRVMKGGVFGGAGLAVVGLGVSGLGLVLGPQTVGGR